MVVFEVLPNLRNRHIKPFKNFSKNKIFVTYFCFYNKCAKNTNLPKIAGMQIIILILSKIFRHQLSKHFLFCFQKHLSDSLKNFQHLAQKWPKNSCKDLCTIFALRFSLSFSSNNNFRFSTWHTNGYRYLPHDCPPPRHNSLSLILSSQSDLYCDWLYTFSSRNNLERQFSYYVKA